MNTALLNKFENYFEKSLLHIFWKDKFGNYLGVSKGKLLNLKHNSEHEIIGHTDAALYKNGLILRINDRKVIAGQKKSIFIESVIKQNIQHQYVSYKAPLFSKTNKVIGVFGVAILLNPNGFLTASEVSEEFTEFLQRFYYSAENLSPAHTYKTMNLTSRQEECLHYLTKGMTMKQIARILGVSDRTVEHHIEVVKMKFDCQTKADLILKILQTKENFH